MTEIARYPEGPVEVTVSREAADFVAKGPGPWPWFDLGIRRAGVLQVLDALGVDPPAWTEPLAPSVLDLFERAHLGDTRVIELLAMGADPDPVNGYRAAAVADVIDLLRAGGATVTQRHREQAANAGASQVEAALRR